MLNATHPTRQRISATMVWATLGLLVMSTSTACQTPGINVVTWEPAAAFDPQGARRLVLVDGEGRASAKRVVGQLMVQEAQGGYFAAIDRRREGVKLFLVGDTGRVEGGAAQGTDAWLRIDVLDWRTENIMVRDESAPNDDDRDDDRDHDRDSDRDDVREAQDGKLVRRGVPGVRGHADLQFSLVRPNGEIVIRELGVRGVADRVARPGRRLDDAVREDAIVEAARGAVRAFLAGIAPSQHTSVLTFDDADSGQNEMLEDESLSPAQLEKKLRRYLEKNPGNAIAHHNLGIVLDVQARYEEALLEFDRALDIVERASFFDARSAAIRRRNLWERMYGPRPPRPALDGEIDVDGDDVGPPPTAESAPASAPASVPTPTTPAAATPVPPNEPSPLVDPNASAGPIAPPAP